MVMSKDEQWFDQYTRMDEALLAINKTLNSPPFKRLPAFEEKQALESLQLRPYEVKEYALDTARTDELVVIDGDFVIAFTDGDLAGCSVKLHSEQNDSIAFSNFNPVRSTFYKFYLTTTAQAGKKLRLFIGREAAAETQPGTTTITTVQGFVVIETDKDTHFTGALAQYAKEDENLAGLLSDNIRITGIGILSDQQLKYKAILWYKDGFEDADLDLDEFCGEIELDIPTYGFQVGGAGTWYMDIRNLHLDYIDSDATKELHISLINMSTTAKNAGATGEVKLFITYEVRA